MSPPLQKILVVGGNGFIGSAVCKAALARGLQVTSVSSSGRPYQTPNGHTPVWVSKVDWQAGDALHPQTFAHLFPEAGGVVHTVGTLIEGGKYKDALKKGGIGQLLGSVFGGLSSSGNPLERSSDGEGIKGSYEMMNRDAGLRVCEAFLSSSGAKAHTVPRPFVYISAEDIGRPVIPARYVETKRQAEQRIEEMMLNKADYRAVYIRPSLVYHAHYRPLTSPVAALFDLSATLHSKVPSSIPTPASTFRYLGSMLSPTRASSPEITPSFLESMANALTIPPIHVDHVAEAICVALDRSDVKGVVDVRRMRELIGWSEKGTHTKVGLEGKT